MNSSYPSFTALEIESHAHLGHVSQFSANNITLQGCRDYLFSDCYLSGTIIIPPGHSLRIQDATLFECKIVLQRGSALRLTGKVDVGHGVEIQGEEEYQFIYIFELELAGEPRSHLQEQKDYLLESGQLRKFQFSRLREATVSIDKSKSLKALSFKNCTLENLTLQYLHCTHLHILASHAYNMWWVDFNCPSVFLFPDFTLKNVTVSNEEDLYAQHPSNNLAAAGFLLRTLRKNHTEYAIPFYSRYHLLILRQDIAEFTRSWRRQKDCLSRATLIWRQILNRVLIQNIFFRIILKEFLSPARIAMLYGYVYTLIVLIVWLGEICFNAQDTCQSLTFFESIYYSGITFFTIGYGDITPTTFTGQALAIASGFLGIFLTSALGISLARRYSD